MPIFLILSLITVILLVALYDVSISDILTSGRNIFQFCYNSMIEMQKFRMELIQHDLSIDDIDNHTLDLYLNSWTHLKDEITSIYGANQQVIDSFGKFVYLYYLRFLIVFIIFRFLCVIALFGGGVISSWMFFVYSGMKPIVIKVFICSLTIFAVLNIMLFLWIWYFAKHTDQLVHIINKRNNLANFLADNLHKNSISKLASIIFKSNYGSTVTPFNAMFIFYDDIYQKHMKFYVDNEVFKSDFISAKQIKQVCDLQRLLLINAIYETLIANKKTRFKLSSSDKKHFIAFTKAMKSKHFCNSLFNTTKFEQTGLSANTLDSDESNKDSAFSIKEETTLKRVTAILIQIEKQIQNALPAEFVQKPENTKNTSSQDVFDEFLKETKIDSN